MFPAPPNVLKIQPYVPGKPIEEVEREFHLSNTVKMASNENPLGPSPMAKKAIMGALERVHYYPDGSGYYLTQALSGYFGIESSRIILGNGSTELIELIAKALLCTNDNAVISEGAFIMYKIAVQAVNGNFRLAPLKNMRHDIKAMKALVDDATRIIYIANPNNPTGAYVPTDEIKWLLESISKNTLVVVDEAYCDFVENPDYYSCRNLLSEFSNILVLGTFSKLYGLAGIRIGYGFTDPGIISILQRVRSPFNTSSLAQTAAIEALKDRKFAEDYIAFNKAEKLFLEEGLQKLQIPYTPSVTNFILIDIGMDCNMVFENLLKEGVIVRPMKAYGFPTMIRVSISLREGNIRFLEAIKKFKM